MAGVAVARCAGAADTGAAMSHCGYCGAQSDAQERIAELQAEAAAMRLALEEADFALYRATFGQASDENHSRCCKAYRVVQQALSGTAGKALLEELEQAKARIASLEAEVESLQRQIKGLESSQGYFDYLTQESKL